MKRRREYAPRISLAQSFQQSANLEVARRQTTLYSTASANPADRPPVRFVITSECVKFADRTTAHEETPP